MVLINSQRCETNTTINFRIFASPPREILYPLAIILLYYSLLNCPTKL